MISLTLCTLAFPLLLSSAVSVPHSAAPSTIPLNQVPSPDSDVIHPQFEYYDLPSDSPHPDDFEDQILTNLQNIPLYSQTIDQDSFDPYRDDNDDDDDDDDDDQHPEPANLDPDLPTGFEFIHRHQDSANADDQFNIDTTQQKTTKTDTLTVYHLNVTVIPSHVAYIFHNARYVGMATNSSLLRNVNNTHTFHIRAFERDVIAISALDDVHSISHTSSKMKSDEQDGAILVHIKQGQKSYVTGATATTDASKNRFVVQSAHSATSREVQYWKHRRFSACHWQPPIVDVAHAQLHHQFVSKFSSARFVWAHRNSHDRHGKRKPAKIYLRFVVGQHDPCKRTARSLSSVTTPVPSASSSPTPQILK